MLNCRHCGTAIRLDEPIPREATCEGCGRDLHACVQCRHYDTSYNNSCRETMADPVADRERRNFCEYFSFSHEPFRASSAGQDRAARARAKLKGLFPGSPAGPDRAAEARARLESLFRKPDREPDPDR